MHRVIKHSKITDIPAASSYWGEKIRIVLLSNTESTIRYLDTISLIVKGIFKVSKPVLRK